MKISNQNNLSSNQNERHNFLLYQSLFRNSLFFEILAEIKLLEDDSSVRDYCSSNIFYSFYDLLIPYSFIKYHYYESKCMSSNSEDMISPSFSSSIGIKTSSSMSLFRYPDSEYSVFDSKSSTSASKTSYFEIKTSYIMTKTSNCVTESMSSNIGDTYYFSIYYIFIS